jgi:hypothetical protein
MNRMVCGVQPEKSVWKVWGGMDEVWKRYKALP